MKIKDWAASIIFIAILILILFPCQVTFIDKSINRLYEVFLIITLITTIIYFIYRIRVLQFKRKWRLLTPAYLGVLFGFFFLINKLISAPPSQSTYLMLYTKANNDNEKIEIIRNHGFTHNWNETKHLINYPSIGLRIERDFKQSKLQGSWLVHKDNPYCSYEGLQVFDNGKLVNK